jgi:hypothetical protein
VWTFDEGPERIRGTNHVGDFSQCFQGRIP